MIEFKADDGNIKDIETLKHCIYNYCFSRLGGLQPLLAKLAISRIIASLYSLVFQSNTYFLPYHHLILSHFHFVSLRDLLFFMH